MSRVFTKNDQYGISSPQIEVPTTAPRSNFKGLPEAMTRTALRQVREQIEVSNHKVEEQYIPYYGTEENDSPVPWRVDTRTIRNEWPIQAQKSSLYAWSTSVQQISTGSHDVWSTKHQQTPTVSK